MIFLSVRNGERYFDEDFMDTDCQQEPDHHTPCQRRVQKERTQGGRDEGCLGIPAGMHIWRGDQERWL